MTITMTMTTMIMIMMVKMIVYVVVMDDACGRMHDVEDEDNGMMEVRGVSKMGWDGVDGVDGVDEAKCEWGENMEEGMEKERERRRDVRAWG